LSVQCEVRVTSRLCSRGRPRCRSPPLWPPRLRTVSHQDACRTTGSGRDPRRQPCKPRTWKRLAPRSGLS